MANRYWVAGGTGNWNDTTNWSASSGGASGASVPGASDAALLDANSGAGTVTLDISPDIQKLTCTGFTGTLAFGTNTISLNSTGTIFTGATTMTVTGTPQIICTDSSATARVISPQAVTEANSISFRITAGTGSFTTTNGQSLRDLDFTDGVNPTGYAGTYANNSPIIYGNFKASTGMTRTAGTQVMTFAATSGTKTIDTAGVTFDCPFTFNGVGGTWQLQAALTSGATRTVTLTNGTLDLDSKTLSCGVLSASGSGTRTLTAGASNQINLTGSSATIINMGTTTNLTITNIPTTINCTYSGSTGTRTITCSGIGNQGFFNINVTAGSDIITNTGSCRLYSLDFTGFTGTWTNAGTRTSIYQDFKLASGMTISSSAIPLEFSGTSGTGTITTNGKTLDMPITFTGLGGTWQFADALTQGSTRAFTLTNGTVKLKAGATSTIGAFATSGSNQKYLQSTVAGTQATLSRPSGTVSTSYLTIQDINATGGATWRAYTTNQNIDAGNNTGWDFIQQVGRYIYTRRKNKRILP